MPHRRQVDTSTTLAEARRSARIRSKIDPSTGPSGVWWWSFHDRMPFMFFIANTGGWLRYVLGGEDAPPPSRVDLANRPREA